VCLWFRFYRQVPVADVVDSLVPLTVASAVSLQVLPFSTVFVLLKSRRPVPEAVQVAMHSLPFQSLAVREMLSLVLSP